MKAVPRLAVAVKVEVMTGAALRVITRVAVPVPVALVAERVTRKVPAATLGVIEVPYFGRKIRLAGDRTFGEWTVVVINDEDFLIRNAMEEWSNQINTFQGNLRGFGAASPLLYKSTAQVQQYSKTGVPIREYTFNGIFPVEVSAIDLDWNSTDSIQEFQVTFAYDWWEVSGGTTGDAGGA